MGNLVDRLERENATETFNVVITPTMESLYMVYLQTVGVISSLLSVVLIFLIIFRSPSHSSTRLQFDLIGLQICFFIFDIHICCLFIPKSTLPYFAGYCMGILCGSISFHIQFTFALVVLLETLAMFFICLLQRFVVLTGHIRHQIALNAIKAFCVFVAALAPVKTFFTDVTEERMIDYIQRTPKMMWLVEKRGWIVYFVPAPGHFNAKQVILPVLFIVVIIFSGGSIVLIKLISKYISKMSSSSRSNKLHTNAIRNLILQFVVFCAFLCLPVTIILVRLVVLIEAGTILFLISEAILCSHGLACSIIALAFNSNFRRALTDILMRNVPSDKSPSLHRMTVHRPSIALSRF